VIPVVGVISGTSVSVAIGTGVRAIGVRVSAEDGGVGVRPAAGVNGMQAGARSRVAIYQKYSKALLFIFYLLQLGYLTLNNP
jgi:hypothetical protein